MALEQAFNYWGAKINMAKFILPLIPPHVQYAEIFCGSAAVFFRKKKSHNEVLNDINGDITNFFWELKTNYDELKKLIDATLHSEVLFVEAKAIINKKVDATPLKRAWAWWVVCNLSFSFTTTSFAFGTTGRGFGTANKRDGFTRWLADRIRDTEIFNRDALDLIVLKDHVDTLFYIDSPYVSSDCALYEGYTIEDFTKLLEALSKIKGKFIMSSYPEPILLEYRDKYKWFTRDISQTVTVTGKREGDQKKKVECLTCNFHPVITIDMFAGTEDFTETKAIAAK